MFNNQVVDSHLSAVSLVLLLNIRHHMDLAIAVLSVFMFLQVGSGQMPRRPNLLNAYSAEVHVTVIELGEISLY